MEKNYKKNYQKYKFENEEKSRNYTDSAYTYCYLNYIFIHHGVGRTRNTGIRKYFLTQLILWNTMKFFKVCVW